VAQLREFYGPLLACVTATKAAYNGEFKPANDGVGMTRVSTSWHEVPIISSGWQYVVAELLQCM